MSLKLHNAMWPGLVGKGEPDTEPGIGLDRMIELTKAAEVNGERFDGIDLFLFQTHFDVDADDDQIKQFCRAAKIFNEHGARSYGCIRIDSATSPVEWASDPVANTKRIAETFQQAADIAADHGERLAAEGEICWAGMHSWKHMLELLEAVDRPGVVGFQADLAHTYLYLLGVNAPEHALLQDNHSEEEFWQAYEKMTDALGPWTFDFHVAQSNGTVFGSGSHDKTGRHCTADAADGKLDIVRCSKYWLLDKNQQVRNNIQHICWDGCMFPNATLETAGTWTSILDVMQKIKHDV